MLDETIHCLMVTGKDRRRRALAERSVESFLEQSYRNRTLLVVNDGPFALADTFRDAIREIRPSGRLPLGALRNLALRELPDGALWVQWDDDDWHHPSLIEQQYGRLLAHAAEGVVLQSQIQYWVRADAAWIERREAIEGTIMCRKRAVDYPATARAEDTRFLTDYAARHPTASWANPPSAYVRLIHGSNTWSEEHFGVARHTPGRWELPPAAASYLRAVLARYRFPSQQRSGEREQ